MLKKMSFAVHFNRQPKIFLEKVYFRHFSYPKIDESGFEDRYKLVRNNSKSVDFIESEVTRV